VLKHSDKSIKDDSVTPEIKDLYEWINTFLLTKVIGLDEE
jgi:hypothetical protein